MRLDDLPESGNIEDRRGEGGYSGGGGFGLPIGGGGLSVGAIVVLGIIGLILGAIWAAASQSPRRIASRPRCIRLSGRVKPYPQPAAPAAATITSSMSTTRRRPGRRRKKKVAMASASGQ